MERRLVGGGKGRCGQSVIRLPSSLSLSLSSPPKPDRLIIAWLGSTPSSHGKNGHSFSFSGKILDGGGDGIKEGIWAGEEKKEGIMRGGLPVPSLLSLILASISKEKSFYPPFFCRLFLSRLETTAFIFSTPPLPYTG